MDRFANTFVCYVRYYSALNHKSQPFFQFYFSKYSPFLRRCRRTFCGAICSKAVEKICCMMYNDNVQGGQLLYCSFAECMV